MSAESTSPHTLRPTARFFVLVSFTALVQSVFATDGVIEVNHAAALAGAITSSDTPGYPVTISETGNYRLTGNLFLPDEDSDGIVVNAVLVSIDLNGFSIMGPTVCSGAPVTSCIPAGSGVGIDSLEVGTSVSNGSVVGAGLMGIRLREDGGLIDGVRAQNNGSTGLVISANGPSAGGTIRNSISNRNGGDGLGAGRGGLLMGNVAYGNGRYGIFATDGSTMIGNTLRSNFQYGLFASGEGIGFSTNVMTDNNMGNANPQIVGTGIEMGTNICGTNTTCP